MSRVWTNLTFGQMQVAKHQASLCIRVVSSKGLLFYLNIMKVYRLKKEIVMLLPRLRRYEGCPEAFLFAYIQRPIL